MAPWSRRKSNAWTLPATAFASKVLQSKGGESGERSGEKANRALAWQKLVWEYRPQVGELGFAGRYVGNACGRAKLVPGIRELDGSVSSAYDDDGEPVAPTVEGVAQQLARFRAERGGQRALVAQIATHLFYVGETNVVGYDEQQAVTDPMDPDRILAPGRREFFAAFSPSELEGKEGEYKVRRKPGDKPKDLARDQLIFRVWQPNPEWGDLPDSSCACVLDTLEKLVLNGRELRSRMVSRLAGAGVLFVPSQAEFPPLPDDPPDLAPANRFAYRLTQYMIQPIADRGAASAVAPFVVGMDKDLIEKVSRITFDDVEWQRLTEERKGLVDELGNGLDLPIEVLTGLGGGNHWSSFEVGEDVLTNHVEPMLETICEGLTYSYVVPILGGEQLLEDGREVVAWFDTSELAVHPDRSKDADSAFDRGALSWPAYRRYKSFNEADAPDDIEREQIREWVKGKAAAPGTTVPPTTDENPGPPDAEASLVIAQALAREAAPVIERAVERAGARVKSKANGNPAVRASLAHVPSNGLVTVALGQAAVRQIVPDEASLVSDEFGPFARSVAHRLRDLGVEGSRSGLRAAVTDRMEALALERLYDPDHRPSAADFLDLVAP